MKATVMYGAGDVRVENVPDAADHRADRRARPRHPRLHLRQRSLALQPDGARATTGRRMGHEFIGIVEAVGADVRTVKAGDVVVAPFAFSDGTCDFCHEGLQTSCLHGGFWGGRARRRPGRSRARPAGRRHAGRAAGRRRRRADAVAADALRRDGHRPPRGASPRASARARRSRSSATAPSVSAA